MSLPWSREGSSSSPPLSPLPSSLLPLTGSQMGRGLLQTHFRNTPPPAGPARTEVGWLHTAPSFFPRRVPALLRRCTRTRRRSHLWKGAQPVHEATSSQSFAGLAQEGRCQEIGTFHWNTTAFGGDLQVEPEIVFKAIFRPWGFGGHDFSVASPLLLDPAGPPQPWDPPDHLLCAQLR